MILRTPDYKGIQASDALTFGYGPWDQCSKCQTQTWVRNGYTERGVERFRCRNCGKSVLGQFYKDGLLDKDRPFGLVTKTSTKAALISKLLLSNHGIRQTARAAQVSADTVLKIKKSLEARLQIDAPHLLPFRCKCGHPLHTGSCRILKPKVKQGDDDKIKQ